QIKVTATDTSLSSATDIFVLTVDNTNDAPTVANPMNDQNTDEDAVYTFTFDLNTFNDVDFGDSLTYTAKLYNDTQLPDWLNFDPSSRTFTGTPLNADVGMIQIKVTATDQSLASIYDSFALTVNNTNDAPTLENAIIDQSTDEDAVYSFTFDLNTFNDVDITDSLTYAAIQLNNTALPFWLSFDANTRTFYGTPLNDDVGVYQIKVTATDTSLTSATDIFVLTVDNTNDAPTVANSMNDQNTDEDAVYTFTFDLNTFNDVDFGDSLTYTAKLYNDTQLPDWLIFDPSTRTFTGIPLNNDVGMIQIKITATDQSLASISDSFALTVNNTNDAPTLENAINDQSTDEDAVYSFTFNLNTFNDVDTTDSLTYTATQSNDSALPLWLSFDANTRTFSGTPLNDDVGVYQIKVTATDTSLTCATDIFALTVVNTNDAPFLAIEIPDQSIDEDLAYTFTVDINTFNDIDSGDTLTYTARLQDDQPLPYWLSFHPTSRSFTGIPSNSDVGVIHINVMAMDKSLEAISDTFAITINDVNDPPIFTSDIKNQIIPEDSDAVILTITVNDIDSDIASLTLNCISTNQELIPNNNLLIQGTNSTKTITLKPVPDVSGNSHLMLLLSDESLTTTKTFMLTVFEINDLPSISMQSYTQFYENTSLSITLTVNDIETRPEDLTITAISSDQSLVLNDEIQLYISELPYTMTITPLADATGELTITVFVCDGTDCVQSSLALDILISNHPPEISSISDQQTFADKAIGPIPFTITDADMESLTLSVYSTNEQLIPLNQIWLNNTLLTDASIQLTSSTNMQYSLTLYPMTKTSGNAVIQLMVSDAYGDFATTAFNILVEKPIIHAIALENGQIEPSGATEVNTNTSNFTFILKPDFGYVVDQVFVDHEYVGNMPQYTFYNISDHHSLTASFKQPIQYTITTLVSSGGTIEPSSFVKVYENQNQTFSISQQTGYVLSQVIIDNIPIAKTTSYTFEKVHDNHIIEAIFVSVPKPQPDFTLNSGQGNIPLTVQFMDNTQNTVTEWLWDFGDGVQSTAQHPKHTYFMKGMYSVRLTTKGPGGTETIIKTDCIYANDIHVDFTATPTTGLYPLTVSFMSDINTSFTQVTWDFGDGYQSQSLNPTHTYTQVGTYSISLNVLANEKNISIQRHDYIQISGRTITGNVKAEDTGKSLENYTVELWQQNESLMADTTTDHNGNYTLSNLPLRDHLIIGVWPPLGISDYHKQMYNGKDGWQGADLLSTRTHDLTQINFVLEKTSNIGFTGRVHNSTKGLPDIQVDTFSDIASFHSSVLTDENGYFTFTGLKPSGDYKVSAWSTEHMVEFYFVLPQGESPGESIPIYSVIIENKATKISPSFPFIDNIDLILDPKAIYGGSISGHVYLYDSTPISTINVNAWSYSLNEGYFATTDENGAYTICGLSLVNDSEANEGYVVSVSSGQLSGISYPYQAYNGVSDKNKATCVTTGATGIDFYLESGSHISGKVTNKYGQAVPDVDINTWSKSTGQHAQATTNLKGEYTFLNMKTAKDYIVAAFPLHYPIQYYDSQTDKTLATAIDLSKGNVFNINFSLDEGYVIQGNVYLENITQKSPEGIWVNIWSQSTMTGGDVSTDINGHFELTGLDHKTYDYIISIYQSGYMPTWYNDNQDQDTGNDSSYSMENITGVQPQLLSQSQPVNLILKTGLSIQGKVLYNAEPQDGIKVEAWSTQSGVFASSTTLAAIQNTSNYTISGLSPGNYNVSIQSNDFKDQTFNITLTNFDLKFIDFVLQKPEHLITGTIKGLDQDVIVYINASANSINYNQTLKLMGTSQETPYTLMDLKPAVDYIVKLYHPNQFLVFNNQTKVSNADLLNVYGCITDIDFTLSPGNQIISGTVKFPGSAQKGDKAWVEAFSEKTGSLGSATVILNDNQEVSYEIKGLKATDDFIMLSYADNYPTQYYLMQKERTLADLVDTSDAILDTSIDFQLSPGASIRGKIYADGALFEGAIVSAFSQHTDSWGGTKSRSDGSYIIEGIDTADDFIIKATRSSDAAPFYYHQIATTRNRSNSTLVSTLIEKHQTEIDMELSNFESIGGKVKDQTGKPLSGIWVSVFSEIQQSGYGTFTKEDGSFIIEDLAKSCDYQVIAESSISLPFVPQTKFNIASNNLNVIFTMYTGWSLTGLVLDINDQPIHTAGIELKSISTQQNRWIETQSDGTFTINGLETAQDYMLSIISPKTASYVPYYESSLVIDSSISKTIILKTGQTIKGYIYQEDGTTPLSDIPVTAFSSSLNVMGQTESDSNGYYEITSLPYATDYELAVFPKQYAKEKITHIATGSTYNFMLQTGGKITGYIRTETGAPLKDVHVEIETQSVQVLAVATSSENGSFAIQGLKKYNTNGSMINDYFVTIQPTGYIAQTQGPMRVEETANFICVKGKENEINGTILDSGQPFTSDITIIIKAYKNLNAGGYTTKTHADTEGHFNLEGLNPDKNYHLRVIAIRNGIVIHDQWAGDNDIGVDERSMAKEYKTLENLAFTFGE
ncbi:Dystroglycan-type cadherin-like domain protein, partial [Candidatus Magnetomorum sp. HK-1]